MKKVPVRIRGVDYPSIRAAARAHGVTSGTICAALDAGTIDDVGRRFSKDRTTVSVVVPDHRADEVRAAIIRVVSEMGIAL